MKPEEMVKAYLGILIVSAFSVLAGYGFRMILARSITQAAYGMFYAVLGFIGIINVFTNPGISMGLVRFVSSAKTREKKYDYFRASVAIQLGLSAAMFLIVAAFLPWVASLIHVSQLALLIGLSSLLIVPFYSSFTALLQAEERVVESKFTELERMIFVTVFFLLLSSMPDQERAISSYIFAALATTLSFLIYPLGSALIPDLPSWSSIKQLLLFSLPIAVSSVASVIFSNMDIVMISHFKGPVEVSLYETANPIASVISYLLVPASMILYPEIARRGKSRSSERIATAALKFVILISVPAVLLMSIYPDIFLRLMFGEKYVPASPALSILSFSVLFWSLFGINSSIILGLGKPEVPTKISLTFGTLNVIADFFFIPWLGFVGASITTTAAAVLSFTVSFFYLRDRKIYSIRNILPAFVAPLPGVITVALLKSLLKLNVFEELAIVSMAFVIVYIASIKILHVLDRKELRHVPVISRYVEWLA